MDTIWDCCENNLAGDSCSPLGQVWRVNMCLGTNLIKKSRMEQDVGTHILHVWAACPRSSPFYLSHASLQRMFPVCFFPWAWKRKEGKEAAILQCWLSLILVIAYCCTAQEAREFFHKSPRCWQSRKCSAWKGISRWRRLLFPPVSKADTRNKGRDFLFKGVERKGLESEEKSRSTNLSYRML